MYAPTTVPPQGLFTELNPPLDAVDARIEAARCLECGGPYAPAPCTVACPAGIDVPGFIGAIARDDLPGAARTIFQENLLGASCARVCPVEELCEGACVLDVEGRRPVEIGRLQRYATDRAFAEGYPVRDVSGPRLRPSGYRVAVIGAGPAGLVAAGELAALGHAVIVYDARPDFGGLIRYAIAPYRQMRDPLPDEVARIVGLGVELRLGQAIDKPERLRAVEAESDAVVLGIGLGADVEVRYPGDELPGVWSSLPFIAAIKTGTRLRLGRRVIVIGGGNTAIDCAREAIRLGATKVTVVYRRTETEAPAYAHEIREAREEGVAFEWLTLPARILGAGWVQALECQRVRLGPPDASGRPRPEPVPDSEFRIAADTVIRAVGQRKRTEFLSWIQGLELERGLVVVNAETGQTSVPNYFAAGDAVNGGATVVEAVRQGKRVAFGVDRYLRDAPT